MDFIGNTYRTAAIFGHMKFALRSWSELKGRIAELRMLEHLCYFQRHGDRVLKVLQTASGRYEDLLLIGESGSSATTTSVLV